MSDQQFTLDVVRDRQGRKVRLGKKKLAVLNCRWDEFQQARTAFALNFNRENFDRLKATGEELVRLQTFLGVWVIHPDNARPGLAADDERIA